MKILFVTPYFFPYSFGGTEVYLLNLCEQLQIQKIECVICSSNASLGKNKKYEYGGIRVFVSENTARLISDVSDLTLNEGYNIIHIHTMEGNINNQFLQFLKTKSLKIFFTPHLVNNLCLNQGRLMYKNKIPCNGFVSQVKCQSCISASYKEMPFVYKQKWFQFVLQKLIPSFISAQLFSDFHFKAKDLTRRISLIKNMNIKVISLSKWYISILKINRIRNYHYIPQAVKNCFIENLNSDKNEQEFKWVYVGRLSIEKGIDNLIAIFNKNGKSNDKLVLCFFLNCELTKFESQILSTIKLNSNIITYVNHNAHQISSILKKCDCLVLPSKICEMAPLTLQEAFACKVPVLVSNFIRERIDEEILGLKFDYSIKNDFDKKFQAMRTLERNHFKGLEQYKACSFTEIAANHIKLYTESTVNN